MHNTFLLETVREIKTHLDAGTMTTEVAEALGDQLIYELAEPEYYDQIAAESMGG